MGGRFSKASGASRGEVVNARLELRLAVIASSAKIPWGVDSDQI
jgi:hypothetical protein